MQKVESARLSSAINQFISDPQQHPGIIVHVREGERAGFYQIFPWYIGSESNQTEIPARNISVDIADENRTQRLDLNQSVRVVVDLSKPGLEVYAQAALALKDIHLAQQQPSVVAEQRV